MREAYLLLGSNQGNRLHWLQQGMQQIAQHCGHIIKVSSVYETAAWGLHQQPDFLNQVVAINTSLAPSVLLSATQNIEQLSGRQREIKWGQRTLDIDILLYGNEIIDLPDLKIPHPFLPERRFTLVPLAELQPNLIHPILHKSITQLLEECKDPLPVKKLSV